MTPRSIRRAEERKARKEMERKTRKDMERKARVAGTEVETSALLPSVSDAQLAANRANAQLSTGPTSSEGKAKSCLNAVKTALTGRTVLLPADDAADYEHHLRSFEQEYSPVGQRERDLVQSIADTWWRLKRIPCLESALLAKGYAEFVDSFEEYESSVRPAMITAQAFLKYEKQIRNLQLQEARLFRRYEKDRAELKQLQQERHDQEPRPSKPLPLPKLGSNFHLPKSSSFSWTPELEWRSLSALRQRPTLLRNPKIQSLWPRDRIKHQSVTSLSPAVCAYSGMGGVGKADKESERLRFITPPDSARIGTGKPFVKNGLPRTQTPGPAFLH